MTKLWGDHSSRWKAAQRRQGVSPQTYNAWHQKSSTQRAILGAKARREGFESGWDAARHSATAPLVSRIVAVKRDLLAETGRNPNSFTAEQQRALVRTVEVSVKHGNRPRTPKELHHILEVMKSVEMESAIDIEGLAGGFAVLGDDDDALFFGGSPKTK
jgi:hypothetical protein